MKLDNDRIDTVSVDYLYISCSSSKQLTVTKLVNPRPVILCFYSCTLLYDCFLPVIQFLNRCKRLERSSRFVPAMFVLPILVRRVFCYDHARSVKKGWKYSGKERSTGLMLCVCCSQVVVLHVHSFNENCLSLLSHAS